MTRRLVVALGLVIGAGCSGVPAPGLALRRDPVIQGKPAPADKAVLALVSMLPGGRGAYLCTVTAISRRHVITAGHCLNDADPKYVRRVFLVEDLFKRGFHPDDFILVTELHGAPGYLEKTGGPDLGVLKLARPLPCSIHPVPVTTLPFDDSDLGADVRIVGFGLTRRNNPRSVGARHQAEIPLRAVMDDSLDIGHGERDRNQAAAKSVPAPAGNSCLGDSGGPAFLDRGVGEEIIGVDSEGIDDCASPTNYTRVDTSAEFLAPFIDDDESDACRDQPSVRALAGRGI
jgi:secreted trypsin-like serine protease